MYNSTYLEKMENRSKWYMGIPPTGAMIVVIYWLETLETWSTRLTSATPKWQDIIAESQNTDHPCRWMYAPQFLSDEERD